MIAVGAAVGFRFHAGPAAADRGRRPGGAAGVAFSWLNLLLGLAVRDPESAGLACLFPVIILFFTTTRWSGFRVVGARERIARHHGRWRDTVLVERRSAIAGTG